MWFQLLRTEDLDCPLALGTANPRLSWVLASDERDARQAAYEIRAASSAVLLKQDRPDLWHTGRVDAPSQRIAYAGAPLRSRQRVYWQVRIWPGTSPRSMSHGPRSSPVDVTSTAFWPAPSKAGYPFCAIYPLGLTLQSARGVCCGAIDGPSRGLGRYRWAIAGVEMPPETTTSARAARRVLRRNVSGI